MRALARLGTIGLAGTLLYYGGTLNSAVIRRPSALLACVAVALVGAGLLLLVLSVRGTGSGDAAVGTSRRARRILRLTWLLVSAASLVGLFWILATPRPALGDDTQFHNDAIALDECAARAILRLHDPYTDVNVFDCYEVLGIGPDRTTPVRRGAFAALDRYPTEAELDAAWRAPSAGAEVEFITAPSYPSLSFVLPAPFAAAGWDPNAVSLAFLGAAVIAVLSRFPTTLRPFALTSLLAPGMVAFTIGGSGDPLYALPLVAAFLWRDRSWSGLALGLACATKQLAWLFVPYWVIALASEQGWPAVRGRLLMAASVFAAANAPFALHDAGAWLEGITTPFLRPTFPLGTGVVLLVIDGVLPPIDARLLYGLLAVAEIGCLAWAWRARRTDPELGLVLALIPLFFAPRSLFSYFFLIPLFAATAVARMPLGGVSPEAVRRSGALTILARPAEA